MKKREQTKQKTRLRLLAAAREEFITKGLLRLSTADIASRSGVAHGTLFFHFQNKENLIITLLDAELLRAGLVLNEVLNNSSDVAELLGRYLDFLGSEEAFFATIARELPFYAPGLRRIVMGRECAIREYFYQAIAAGIKQGRYQALDIATALNFLFGTISYYLAMRDTFMSGDSVLAEKQSAIIGTFMQFLER